MMDLFSKEISALKFNPFENLTDFLIFGHTLATSETSSFKGEMADIQIGISNNTVKMEKCARPELRFEPNFTNIQLKLVVVNNNIETSSEGFADVCNVPLTSILLNFYGTFSAHMKVCQILYGKFHNYHSSLPNFWKNSISQCGQDDKPVMWVESSWNSSSESLDVMCNTIYKNNTLERTYCHMNVNCSICVTYQNLEILLFGEIKHFDREYKVQSDRWGNLMLIGSNSKMVKENGVWVLKSLVHQDVLINKKSLLPLGRNNWTRHNCLGCIPNEVSLTFSACLPNEFCCSNGQCITGQKARCNGVVQCNDASDELNCVNILKDQGYQIKQIPSVREINDGNAVLKFRLAYTLNVKFVSEIFTTDGILSIDFEVRIRWTDYRLTLKNLRSNYAMDADIWEPKFSFYATLSDGDAIAPASEESTLYAKPIQPRNSTLSFDDSYMGKVFYCFITSIYLYIHTYIHIISRNSALFL